MNTLVHRIHCALLAGFVALACWGSRLQAAEPDPQANARRFEIPLGGDFRPNPKVPVIMAVAHGARVVLSRDDGKTWRQVFFGYPAADHGLWSAWDIAYTNGLFVVFCGWGAPGRGSHIGSDDGVTWKHLANAARKGRFDSRGMSDTWSGCGGDGVFVSWGDGFLRTTDFGKTWETIPTPAKSGHVKVVYANYQGGRFLAYGRGPTVLVSSDQGRSWKEGLKGFTDGPPHPNAGDSISYYYNDLAYGAGVFIITDHLGALARRSQDGGETWTAHPTGAEHVSLHYSSLSFVRGEFWLVGKKSRASKDGIHWRDLPPTTPTSGRIVETERGTLISVSRKRDTILRSEDGATWQEVHRLTPEEMKPGGGFRAAVTGRIREK